MPPHIESLAVPGLSLDVSAEVRDQKLRLTYSLKNQRQQAVFPFNVLWDSGPTGSVVPAALPVYVTVPQSDLVQLSQQIPPYPKSKRVEQRIVPFAVKLLPGQTLSRSYELALPLQEYNPYFPADEGTREGVVSATQLIFTLQVLADQSGIQARPAPLPEAVFLIHPALLAKVETLRSPSIHVKLAVKKRLDAFEEF